ncbi:replication initiation negative regulator SeqA [Vibrio sp. SS-MA-C1-2]|uniref:replication initiation negative regulator SeqA n=1 Tax=Vibrio sp. SS-MA-C1-2 TaxID=2908646 RepID=UPI001F46D6FF|nr:replication initiation negative regulator SeqA [Vibrio sp. SS-MA-C1-2]UJF20166.1 replication initiation negative regulator SeqA [Vibrio sp. SS-MA-C1-2]
MKTIEVDEELYRFIAGQTQHIGESASDILRRLLQVDGDQPSTVSAKTVEVKKPQAAKSVVVSRDAAKDQQLDRVREIRELLISDKFAAQDKAIGRFMTILSTLYRIDNQGFGSAAALKGRTRLYFADNPDTLLASGKTTKPKSIPSTPYWVITNTNTGRKRQMVEQLMLRMGFTADFTDRVCKSI